MKPLATALLAGALLGCNEPAPCDDVPGTCLNVYLLAATADAGDRITSARLRVVSDQVSGVDRTVEVPAGGQILPLLVPLPLPEGVERSICVQADATRNDGVALRGVRLAAELSPGAHRLIWIRLGAGVQGCSSGLN